MNKASQEREEFKTLIQRWITIEDNTINMADDLIKQAKNPMVQILIDLLKRDSVKHKHILEGIRLHIESTITFDQDDMKIIDSFIERHSIIEKTAVETAENAVNKTKLPIPRMLLKYLLEDERKHDLFMDELNRIKSSAMIGT